MNENGFPDDAPVPRRRSRFVPALNVLWAVILCLLASGCGEVDPITQYQAPKEKEVAASLTPETGNKNFSAEQEGMGKAWFLKLTTPPERMGELLPKFAEVVMSLSFSPTGEPTWQSPSDWKERRGDAMRLATLEIPGEKPLELAISSLPAADPESSEFLLMNLNRWRGQLKLPPRSGADWMVQAEKEQEFQQIPSNGRKVSLVKLTGMDKDGQPSVMFVAIVPQGGKTAQSSASFKEEAPTNEPTAEEPEKPLTYTVPEGWQEGPGNAFRIASFAVVDGEKKLDISVTTAGGNLLENINRWRDQVKLEAIDLAELEKTAKTWETPSGKVTFVELVGPTESILGAVLSREGRTWFFKARGDGEVAKREIEKFEQFVQSVRFR